MRPGGLHSSPQLFRVEVLVAAGKKSAVRAQFKLVSPDIRPNGPIAMEQVFNGFGCSGQNVAPALKWSGAPADTKSFALVGYMINANAIGKAKLTGKFGRKK